MAENSLFGKVYNPDVLTCLANLSNDEVFTPPDIANAMLDMLPQELFENPDTKFLDPACKSGVFLREIAKRLIKGLEWQIPDLQERLDHIFHKQLYGIAITELTSLLSRRSVYCSKYPNSEYSVSKFADAQGNIRFKRILHQWGRETVGIDGKKRRNCVYCGASKDTYDRGIDLETHAYEWIHVLKPEDLLNMKFDVIISNPPYQLSDGGQKASATPIYQKFVTQAKRLKPRYMTFVIPSRWFSGGRGLDNFRNEMLKDKHIRKLTDYTDSEECFPGVDIAGGICYFLWDRDNEGMCEVTTIHSGSQSSTLRDLNEYPIFIRHNEALSIIKKVAQLKEETYNNRVSSQKPFGLRTYIKPEENGDITLRYNGGTGPYWRKNVTQSIEWIDKWKVIMSYLTYDHAGRADKEGKRKIFSTMEVLPPNSVCTETYLVVDALGSEKEAQNLLKYLQTKFVRFLVAQTTSTQHIAKNNFVFVPVQNFVEEWTDSKLNIKYGLNEEEIRFIDSMIKPIDIGE